MSDEAGQEKDPETGRFLPGNSGFGGRPKGSRNKLGEQFLTDLQALWQDEGAKCLKEARDEKPMEFAKMVAGLLPKELLVKRAPVEDMSDEDLADTIDRLHGLAAQLERDSGSNRSAGKGGKAPGRMQ